MAPVAGQLSAIGVERLAVAAARTHGVRERDVAPQALHDAGLVANDGPPLRRMVADLEEAFVDRDVPAVHIEHHDIARRDAHDRIPGAAAQGMGTARAHPGPAFGLEASGGNMGKGHTEQITTDGAPGGVIPVTRGMGRRTSETAGVGRRAPAGQLIADS